MNDQVHAIEVVDALDDGRHTCAFSVEGATQKYCQELTAISRRNEVGCMESKCKSPWRLCITCVNENTIAEDGASIVIDPDSGLCNQHFLDSDKMVESLALGIGL